MRVLWVTNIVFPEALNKPTNTFGGGWMTSLIDLVKDDVDLGVVSQYSNSLSKKVNGVDYYLIKDWKSEIHNVINDFKPDLIHIHGSEYPHSLIVKKNAGCIPCVCSVQGLIGVYARYSLGGLSCADILKNTSIKDVLRKSGPYLIKSSQRKRGVSESKLFTDLKYAIGRTEWDKEHVLTFNPNIKYFYCSESLRECFYDGIWNLEKANTQTLFCCNSSVPLKGVHQIVKAMAIVVKQFPDVRLRVAGKNILGNLSLRDRLRMSGYDRYLRHLIYSLKLENNVSFLGTLSAEGIKNELLHCNTFILGSSIENSPNSLAEAQMLGVPVIASNVGGVQTMMGNKFMQYTYRFEEYEMLAHLIMRNFENKEWGDYSRTISEMAHHRHNKSKIKSDLLGVYKSILELEV